MKLTKKQVIFINKDIPYKELKFIGTPWRKEYQFIEDWDDPDKIVVIKICDSGYVGRLLEYGIKVGEGVTAVKGCGMLKHPNEIQDTNKLYPVYDYLRTIDMGH